MTMTEPRRWSTPAFSGPSRFTDEQYRRAQEHCEQQRGKPYIGIDFDHLDQLTDSERLALAVVLLDASH